MWILKNWGHLLVAIGKYAGELPNIIAGSSINSLQINGLVTGHEKRTS